LLFPRAGIDGLTHVRPVAVDETAVRAVLQAEQALCARVPSGRYWAEGREIEAASLAAIDALWLSAYDSSMALVPVAASQRHVTRR
jgi:hypothetical protein